VRRHRPTELRHDGVRQQAVELLLHHLVALADALLLARNHYFLHDAMAYLLSEAARRELDGINAALLS